MKIRLHINYFIKVVPEKSRYHLYKTSENKDEFVAKFSNVNEAVYAAIDSIITEEIENEITLSQYQNLIDDLSKQLFEGVVEYEN